MKGETESELIAAQGQTLRTEYHGTKITQTEKRENVDCKQFDETVERSISACVKLVKEQYIQRHDTVCAELYCNRQDTGCAELYYNRQDTVCAALHCNRHDIVCDEMHRIKQDTVCAELHSKRHNTV
jgi:hypothetical protein